MLKLLNKIHLFFLVCFFIFNTNLSANPKIDVKTAILIDYDSDEILYELEPDMSIYSINDKNYDGNNCF